MKVNLKKIGNCEQRYKYRVEQKAEPEALVEPQDVDTRGLDEEKEKEPTNNVIPPEEVEERRKQMLESSSIEPIDFALERAIGNNDSVYSNFIELIAAAKEKVCRISVKSGIREIYSATGFMVSERLLLTNEHVFQTKEDAVDSEAQFFFEFDIHGRQIIPTTFKLAPDEFFHADEALDYCFVAVQPMDITDTFPLSAIGYHFLDVNIGKLVHEGKERLNIIHHPDGDLKQLSIRENQFVKMLPNWIWYKSDTAPGSSGAPVFNDQWQVVALHHSGVPKKNEAGEIIDKNGEVIDIEDEEVDESRVIWIANEGIRISVLLKDVFEKFPNDPLIAGLRKKPTVMATHRPMPMGTSANDQDDHLKQIDSEPAVEQTQNQDTMNNSNVNISFPPSLIETNGKITIHIDNQRSLGGLSASTEQSSETAADLLDASELTLRQVNFEECQGYQSNFLCMNIPIPKPKAELEDFVAETFDGETVLDYHHYSVILHRERRMPIISAINIDGNPEKRKDTSGRPRNWLRDARVSSRFQLNNSFYSKSGFDRGHMSRSEDANYGDTPAIAKRNKEYTFFHTNACPQVARLNQSSRGGLWGRLENLVLERGVEEEKGKFAKITVFNGPIFSEGDREFKEVQIPMEFWKVILWYNDNDELQATAFTLSQEKLVSRIVFDEAININQDRDFKPFQISLAELEEKTKLDFSAILPFDTFDDNNDNDVPVTESKMVEMLRR